MKENFTIAICTFNRHEMVQKCLEHLTQTMVKSNIYPVVLIIDNEVSGLLKNEISNYIVDYPQIQYIQEKSTGLSYARNRAINLCKTSYLAFIDDDAYPDDIYLKQLKVICSKEYYDVIGGFQIPYSDKPIPKWYSFDSNSNTWASGFNIVFRLEALKQVNGFDPLLGMKGKSIGYGEEILPQVLIKKNNGKIKIDSDLKVYHYIQPYKLTKIWQFKSAFAQGRDSWKFLERPLPCFRDRLYLIRQIFINLIKLRWLIKISEAKKLVLELGRIYGIYRF